MFNVSTVFTHKTLFEPMWCFQNCLLCSLHSIQFYILMSWGIDCSLMKKWPWLAVIQPAVGCNVNIYLLFQFAGKADNDGRAQSIPKTMPGNYICHQVGSWPLISAVCLQLLWKREKSRASTSLCRFYLVIEHLKFERTSIQEQLKLGLWRQTQQDDVTHSKMMWDRAG